MPKRIYLDNCCYNRPYDDQMQLKIHLETLAKLKVQVDIKEGKYILVWSYVLDYENSRNPYKDKRDAISPWRHIADEYVYESESVVKRAEIFVDDGIKVFDALHLSSAIEANCDFFLTTDKKLINASINEIRTISPIQFIEEEML